MKKLGVIGGLGPMATALFMKMIIEMTDAENDQEHIEMIVYNCPQIPDRTDYILGKSIPTVGSFFEKEILYYLHLSNRDIYLVFTCLLNIRKVHLSNHIYHLTTA